MIERRPPRDIVRLFYNQGTKIKRKISMISAFVFTEEC